MFRGLFISLFIVTYSVQIKAQDDVSNPKKTPLGLTVRLVPAFFYNTYGIEVEYPVSKHSSFGFGASYYAYSPTNGSTVIDEGEGLLAEIQYKYYFSGEAPMGLYAMVAAGYNDIDYPDGATRPFVLYDSFDFKSTAGETRSITTDLYIASIGIGYQVIMIEPHLSGNVVLGAQFQNSDAGVLTSMFIAPSFGWTF